MPLPSWRTGTTAQAAHGCTSTTRPPGRGPLFVTPPEKQPDACRSRCRTSRRAQCSRRLFFCRGHAAVPVFIAPWLVVDVRFDVLFETRGDGREPRGRKVLRCFGRCFAAGVRRLVLRGSSGVGRRLAVRSGRLSARHGCEAGGVAQVSKVPHLFVRQSLGMRVDAVHQFLKNLAH
jgi:hypothetical protein